jgi:transposase InsO family protein
MSTYYYKPRVTAGEIFFREAELQNNIEIILADFPGYGYRRVTKALARQGQKVNHKKVLRIMREHGLLNQVRKAFKVPTTDSNHPHRIYPNLLPGLKLNGPNQVWVADITYIRILTGFIYLAVVMDLYSRKVIGWALSRSLRSELCLEALQMAIETRDPGPCCVHHSDRGVQYACDEYIMKLQQNGIVISMSRKGNPYDNAFMESFMKTLKYDEVHLWNYETIEDVNLRIPEFLENVYNKKRLHSSLEYLTPEEFETKIMQQKIAERPVLNL